MDALADRSLGQLLDQVAAKTPSPGGGSSAALVCALSAGLVEMAAAFTRARDEYAERHERMAQVTARANELRAAAVALAEQELHVYGAVLEALRMPEDVPERAQLVDTALSDAADSPLAIARAASEIAELATEVARTCNPHLRGDAVTGALLAGAACDAAVHLTALNLTGRPDDPRREEARQLRHRPWMAALMSRPDV